MYKIEFKHTILLLWCLLLIELYISMLNKSLILIHDEKSKKYDVMSLIYRTKHGISNLICAKFANYLHTHYTY